MLAPVTDDTQPYVLEWIADAPVPTDPDVINSRWLVIPNLPEGLLQRVLDDTYVLQHDRCLKFLYEFHMYDLKSVAELRDFLNQLDQYLDFVMGNTILPFHKENPGVAEITAAKNGIRAGRCNGQELLDSRRYKEPQEFLMGVHVDGPQPAGHTVHLGSTHKSSTLSCGYHKKIERKISYSPLAVPLVDEEGNKMAVAMVPSPNSLLVGDSYTSAHASVRFTRAEARSFGGSRSFGFYGRDFTDALAR